MSVEYDEYLRNHILGVKQGLLWMYDNLKLSEEDRSALNDAINDFNHDQSKYTNDEYPAYDLYFYGNNRSFKVVQDFNYAWLHHIHNNPHHWQYWVLIEDDPKTDKRAIGLKMPLKYVFEMIADWWSFSWRSGNLSEIFDWYQKHKEKIIMHDNTRKHIEGILDQIKHHIEEEAHV